MARQLYFLFCVFHFIFSMHYHLYRIPNELVFCCVCVFPLAGIMLKCKNHGWIFHSHVKIIGEEKRWRIQLITGIRGENIMNYFLSIRFIVVQHRFPLHKHTHTCSLVCATNYSNPVPSSIKCFRTKVFDLFSWLKGFSYVGCVFNDFAWLNTTVWKFKENEH